MHCVHYLAFSGAFWKHRITGEYSFSLMGLGKNQLIHHFIFDPFNILAMHINKNNLVAVKRGTAGCLGT